MLQKIKTFTFTHKIITGLIVLGLIYGVYYIFIKNKTNTETRYVTEVVKKGNVTATVTGTGQVEALDTLDLKPKTSGDITYIGVKVGDSVKKGKLIATIDSRDAKLALENAKITLEKLVSGPDSLTLLQKNNSLTKSYNDGWNTVSSFNTDMNSMIDEVYNIYSSGFLSYKNTSLLSSSGKEKVALAEKGYYDAKNSFDSVNKLYKSLSRSSSKEEIKNLINKSYEASIVIENSVKNTETVFNYVVNYLDYQTDSNAISTKTDINSWLTSSKNYVSSLLSISDSLNENTQSLEEFLIGADELDIRSAQLTVENKKAAYNDCFVYAPFDGTIAALTVSVGEPSGSSIGTLITKNKLATISLNEVDIAKIELGQKVTLTFDAVENLTITGKVAEIDSIGTVSQGVVTYVVKINLDTGDNLIKPGMSVSATIITDIVQDVIVVPNSAVKSKNGLSYVDVFDYELIVDATGTLGSLSSTPPKQNEIEAGLIDDNNTEIISGLKEGDIIVIKTIIDSTSSTATKSTTPSILNAVGGSGNKTGGGFNMPRN
jgi:HlyD family secretion protein